MAATDFIVAIELGSSKITGIAGRSIRTEVYKYWPSPANLRLISQKRSYYNLDKTAQSLTSIIKKLESTLRLLRKGICRHRRTIAPHYPQHGSTPLGRRN